MDVGHIAAWMNIQVFRIWCSQKQGICKYEPQMAYLNLGETVQDFKTLQHNKHFRVEANKSACRKKHKARLEMQDIPIVWVVFHWIQNEQKNLKSIIMPDSVM